MEPQKQQQCAWLSLPYDIRHVIYQHAFPPTSQIYIQADSRGYFAILSPEHEISTALLRTCRALNREGSEYLYNHYLFNVLGSKSDCLAAYDDFVQTVDKYGRDKVHVHVLGNGAHSETMCISLHVGSGKTEVVRKRARGEARRIEDVRAEVRRSGLRRGRRPGMSHPWWYVASLAMTVLVGVCAWLMAVRRLP